MVLKLLDVAALLPSLEAFGPGIVDQGDLLSPLDEAVEIVGPDRVLILIGRKSEGLAKLRRDER